MKNFVFLTVSSLAFMTASVFSAQGIMPISAGPTNQALNKQISKMESKKIHDSLVEQQQHQSTTQAVAAGAKEVMIIDPGTRAQDYKNAFDFLKSHKTATGVTFLLSDGQVLSNILELSLMPGGSLIIFTINTTKGLKYEVVKVEDIESIGHM